MLNGSQCPVLLDVRDKVVMVGRGEILVKQSMPKLHCRLGVTDLRVKRELLWSSGRD